MIKVIIHNPAKIAPFQQPARDLRLRNQPLWLTQRDLLAEVSEREITIQVGEELPAVEGECIVFQDNLFFDQEFIQEFISKARKSGKAAQCAFSLTDPAVTEHILPLSSSFTKTNEQALAPLWYFPRGTDEPSEGLVIDLGTSEAGYYHVPTYMAGKLGDLVYYIPQRSMIAIDSWVHIFYADIIFGLFGRGIRFERQQKGSVTEKLRLFWRALIEGKQLLDSSALVKIGKNCVIDPSAVIHGPTSIGDNVTVGAGVVIENAIIGDNVNISQGAQIMLSVVGDNVFLPFRAALFMTTLMESSTVAQNTCLQMCVVGRNTFIGAGTTFTDFNLLPVPIRARNGEGELAPSNRPVLGAAVGHNCRIGAGFVIYPGRMIDSDVILINADGPNVIKKNVMYEQSHHHAHRYADSHKPDYSDGSSNDARGWE